MILDETELESLDHPRDSICEVDCYVGIEELYPSLSRDKTYYLLPDGAAAQQAYQLFQAALEETETMAVAELTITSTSPMAIYPEDGVLKMTLLEYVENLKPAEAYAGELLDLELPPKIFKEAVALVKRHIARDFDWTRYQDARTRTLQKLIDSKIEAGESTTPATAVVDLSSAFRSLKKGRSSVR